MSAKIENTEPKVTMKVPENVHRKIQIMKGMLGTKTYYDAIEILIDEAMERAKNNITIRKK